MNDQTTSTLEPRSIEQKTFVLVAEVLAVWTFSFYCKGREIEEIKNQYAAPN